VDKTPDEGVGHERTNTLVALGRRGILARSLMVVGTALVALGVSYLCWLLAYMTVLKPSTGPMIWHSCPEASATLGRSFHPLSDGGIFGIPSGGGPW